MTRMEPSEGLVLRFWRISVTVLSIPLILLGYLDSATGREFGIRLFTKISLIFKMARNNRRITTASHFLEHLTMATQIMRVPCAVEGCVVECGSFKGGSAANLSLVCDLCNRKLEIFDSFAGLPEPTEDDKDHLVVTLTEVHSYEKGGFAGTLPEVQRNITRYGKIGACNFNVGYFDTTLPHFSEKCVLAYLDVDLVGSLETCFLFLWPLLQEGCYLFTHEAHHMEIAKIFFSESWWQSKMGCAAPGLIGAGTGLGLLPASGGFRSALGYTIKSPKTQDFNFSLQGSLPSSPPSAVQSRPRVGR